MLCLESIEHLKDVLRRNKILKDKELKILKKELIYELIELYGEKRIVLDAHSFCTITLEPNTMEIYLKDYKYYRCQHIECEKLENVPLDHLYMFLHQVHSDFLVSYKPEYLSEICINFKLELINFFIKNKDNLINESTYLIGIHPAGDKKIIDVIYNQKTIVTFSYIRAIEKSPITEHIDYDFSSINELDVENYMNLIINNYENRNNRSYSGEISSPRIN